MKYSFDNKSGSFFAIIPILTDWKEWVWLEWVDFEVFESSFGGGLVWHFYSRRKKGDTK